MLETLIIHYLHYTITPFVLLIYDTPLDALFTRRFMNYLSIKPDFHSHISVVVLIDQ